MRRTSFRVSVVVALVLAFSGRGPSLAAGQAAERPAPVADAAAATPEMVLQQYTQAMKSADWPAAARLMHPEALAQFQRIFTGLASMDPTGKTARDMFKLGDGESIESITPETAFAKVMNTIVTAAPAMSEMLRSAAATPLGTVREGDLVHVVYRSHMQVQGSEIIKVEVLTTKRSGDAWRAMLRGDMENALMGMLRRLATKPGA